MEYTLLDGRTPPNKGDNVRVRVLRSSAGELVVDRPFKDRPLKVAATAEELTIPSDQGTYEISGTVSTVALADANGPDYFLLDEYTVTQVSSDLVSLPADRSDVSSGSDEAVPGVDVDIEDILDEELTEEQDTSKGLSSGAKRLGDNYNDLLIGSR